MGTGDDEQGDDERLRITRRRAIATGASTAAGAAAANAALLNGAALARERRLPTARDGSFEWGVSSGFPQPRSIVVWTRVGGLDRSSRLFLTVARDRGFRRIVEERKVTAEKRGDFTVHAKVKGLKPRTEYFYRFHTRNSRSRIGRFRTLPPSDSYDPIRIGFFSCQNWQAGYYNAHDGIAAEDDLDLVLCLGDYIYENRTYDGPRRDNTGDNKDGDVQRQKEFRQKYRLYQSDRSLQQMHANHPFVAIWDDHEVEDNYAGDQASPAADPGKTNPGEKRRVSIKQRRANGYEAFFEAMPRIRRRGARSNRIYARARLGRMADLFLLDERQYRDPQPCGDGFAQPCPTKDAPGRRMLGDQQKGWLKQRLAGSGAQWKILGNGLMLMSFDLAPDVPVTVDSWDGYGAERTELANHIIGNDISDVVALTGDIHTFFAGTVTTTGRADGTPAATEFVGGSITSQGVKELLGGAPIGPIARAVRLYDPHITYAEFTKRGYGVIELSSDEAICEFKAPTTIQRKGAPVRSLAKFRVESGTTDVERLG